MNSRDITSDATISDEVSSWHTKSVQMEMINVYVTLVLSFAQICTALVILMIIVVVRKRSEMFLILTPLFLIICNICGFIGTCLQLSRNEAIGEFDLETEIMFDFTDFFLLMSHWVFGA